LEKCKTTGLTDTLRHRGKETIANGDRAEALRLRFRKGGTAGFWPFVRDVRQSYIAGPDSTRMDLLCDLSKQQVAWLAQRATQMQRSGGAGILAPLSGSLN
jgi:hypothetical protein